MTPRTDGCSIADVMTCLPCASAASQMPRIARLFASVPPDVKTISFARDPIGDLPSRLIDGSARLLPEHVHARGVPKFVRQVRQHRLDDSGIDGRSGA